MRLRLVTTERDPFWIVGNPSANERVEMSSALSETMQAARNQQGVSGAEWDSQVFFDRKNQRFSVDASTRYEFEDEWARMDFIARLIALDEDNQEHLWSGDVWLRLDKSGTIDFREWKLPDAVVSLTGFDPSGAVGLILRYRVQAGGFNGDTHEGTSEIVNLVGYTTAGTHGLIITAAELQALLDSALTVDTIDFALLIEAGLTGGGGASAVFRWLVPTGTGGGFGEYELPVASSIAALGTDLDAEFGLLDISGSGSQLFFDDTPGDYEYIIVAVYERHIGPYGSLISTLIGTYNSSTSIGSTLHQLTGVSGVTEHDLIGINET